MTDGTRGRPGGLRPKPNGNGQTAHRNPGGIQANQIKDIIRTRTLTIIRLRPARSNARALREVSARAPLAALRAGEPRRFDHGGGLFNTER